MSAQMPPARPRETREQISARLRERGIIEPVALYFRRGYYLRTMGNPVRNDRGIYDDAAFLVSPSAFLSWNANTDPSIRREGIAVLRPGVWRYRIGIHGLSRPRRDQYEALVQAARVTVRRDGVGDDTGWFGINIHRGENSTTSSIGCLTIPPAQWPEFIGAVKREMRKYTMPTLPVLLEEEPLFRT